MCIAFLDPGNLQADLQVGAYTGYGLVSTTYQFSLLFEKG